MPRVGHSGHTLKVPADDILTEASPALAAALQISAARHDHLCPRQVLGARMGIYAGELLEMSVPRSDKFLIVIVESDGCFSDGIAAATGCEVGHRTLRVADYGKIAATFVDVRSGRALRIRPRLDVRDRVASYAEKAESRWHAYGIAYQRMPKDELLDVETVHLVTPVERIVSHPDRRTLCRTCGEEVSNEREVHVGGDTFCLACSASAEGSGLKSNVYYRGDTDA